MIKLNLFKIVIIKRDTGFPERSASGAKTCKRSEKPVRRLEMHQLQSTLVIADTLGASFSVRYNESP